MSNLFRVTLRLLQLIPAKRWELRLDSGETFTFLSLSEYVGDKPIFICEFQSVKVKENITVVGCMADGTELFDNPKSKVLESAGPKPSLLKQLSSGGSKFGRSMDKGKSSFGTSFGKSMDKEKAATSSFGRSMDMSAKDETGLPRFIHGEWLFGSNAGKMFRIMADEVRILPSSDRCCVLCLAPQLPELKSKPASVGRGLGRGLHELETAAPPTEGRGRGRFSSSSLDIEADGGRGRGRGRGLSPSTSQISGSPTSSSPDLKSDVGITPGSDQDDWVDPNILEATIKKYADVVKQYPQEKHILLAGGGSLKLSQELWSDLVQAKLIDLCKVRSIFGVSKDNCLSEGSAVNTLALFCYFRFELTKRGVGQCFLVAVKSYMERYLIAWNAVMAGSGISVHPVSVDVNDPIRANLYMEHDAYAFDELYHDLKRAGLKK